MFEVIPKNNSKIIRTVYSVRTNKNSNTEFLIYDGHNWMWMDCSLYKPKN